MAFNTGLRRKCLILFVLAVLVPLFIMGIFSVMEMNQAMYDVQEKLSSMNSTSLNRSSLIYATSGNTDQEQLAIAKAEQYNEFFKRIKTGNEILAGYFENPINSENCTITAAIWVAPYGNNTTFLNSHKDMLRGICLPSKMLQRLVKLEGVVERGYLVTSDGLMVYWPSFGDRISPEHLPFYPRSQPSYKMAQQEGKTVWTAQDAEVENDSLTLTCATPVYRNITLFGVVCLDVSLSNMYGDLSSLRDRGYPFIVDGKGTIVMLPKVRRGDAPWDTLLIKGNLNQADSASIRDLATKMATGVAGSSVLSAEGRDWYIAYAPIPSVGWSLAIAFPAEDMLLPARYIESGVKDTAKGATSWLEEAVKRLKMLLVITAIIGSIAFGGVGLLLGRDISASARRISEAARRIASGDLDFRLDITSKDEMYDAETAIEEMRTKLKQRMAETKTKATALGRDRLEADLGQELQRDTEPVHMPVPEGLKVSYRSFGKRNSTFFDIFDLEGGTLALIMGEVSGEGLAANVLAVVAKTLIRGLASVYDPAETLSRANILLGERARGMSVTCFFAFFDPEDKTITYVNAGHAPPFVVRSNGAVDTLSTSGISLGTLDSLSIEMDIRELEREDLLVIYSDKMASLDKLGLEKLISTVRLHKGESPDGIIEAVQKEAGKAQNDAVIIVVKGE